MKEVQRKKYRADDCLAQLKSEIISGKYRSGTFLPPERNLAEMLEISRGTLRKILKELHNESFLRVNPGKGAYVIYGGGERKGLRRILVRFPNTDPRNKASEAVGALLGICSAASKIHAETLISFAADNTDSAAAKIIESFSADEIQGALFFEACDYRKEIIPLEKAGVPYVVINLEREIAAVTTKMDYRQVGRSAGKHLVSQGHKKIAVLAGQTEGQNTIYKEMLAGFRGALAEEEIFLEKELVVECFRLEKARDAALQILKDPEAQPTAFFTMRDYRAEGLYAACRELNLRIPEDIAVVSYDNITWPGAENAGLTTIREQVEEMGEAAVEMLASWVESGRKPENRLFPGELIIRASSRK